MDIRLSETLNGGDFNLITIEDEAGTFSDLDTDGGLRTATYLSHFGGNIEANTTGNEQPGVIRKDYFGNVFVLNDLDRRANSNLERSLIEITITTGNLLKYEDASELDLAWLIVNKIAKTISSIASIIAPERVEIEDTIEEPEKDTDTITVWEFEKNLARVNV